MKFLSSIFLVLLLKSIQIHSSSPEFKVLYNVSYPMSGVQYFANDIYYFSYSYYNVTSGEVYPVKIPQNCTIYPQLSPQVIPWCYGQISKPDSHSNYQINFLNSYLNESIGLLDIGTFPSSTTVHFEYTNGFLAFFFSTEQGGLFNCTLAFYDLQNKVEICPKANGNQLKGANSIFTDGERVVTGYMYRAHNVNYNYFNCSTGESFETPGPLEFFEYGLYAFNDSNVFIHFYEYDQGLYTSSMIQTATLNSSNILNFGPSLNISVFYPYNGTHFFISYNNNGNVTLGLYVINSELQIVEAIDFTLGIPDYDITANPVYGTSWFSIDLGDTFVTFDIDQRAIIAVDSTIPPIVLSNGSVVNITAFGYFIQSPGGPFDFVFSPFTNADNNIYQDPTDFNQFYTLFIPTNEFPYYSKCLLTHYNVTSSIIAQINFPNCPVTLNGNPISIKDIQYDSNGNPHVVYRDTYGSVFIVNSAGYNGPLKSAYPYSTVQISLNLTNGTLNFVGAQLNAFVLARISISTGAMLTSVTFKTFGLSGHSIFKANAQYFVLCYTDRVTMFDLWDLVNLVKVNSVQSINAKTQSSIVPGFVLGFNASAPANYSGIIYWNTVYIFLMNSGGETTILNPGNVFNVYDVVPISSTQFYSSQYQSQLGSELLYDISEWGLSPVEAKRENNFIIYN